MRASQLWNLQLVRGRRGAVLRRRIFSGPALAGWLLALSILARTQTLNKADYLHRSTVEGGNDFYEIVVEDVAGAGVGLYSVRTGARHPITASFSGQRQDLLVGARKGFTGSSYLTVRSYSSQTDYVQSEFAESAAPFRAVWLDTLFVNDDSLVTDFITPILAGAEITGFRATYNVPGLPRPMPPGIVLDTMTIVQVVNVHGSTFDDSWVEISTMVRNDGAQPLRLGLRYLWDLGVGPDDGPLPAQKGGTSFGDTEARLPDTDFSFFVTEANDALGAFTPPGYQVFGSVLTPANLKRTEFQPTRLQHVFWPLAFLKTFDYEIDSTLVITKDVGAPLSGGDNALQYFWGEDQGAALTVAPGDSLEVTQVLFAGLPGREPQGVLDLAPPVCTFANFSPGPPKRFEILAQDLGSGLAEIKIRDSVNVNIEIEPFDVGTIAPVRIVGTVRDNSQRSGFTLEVIDLCGRRTLCDPVFLTLLTDLRIFEYRVEPAYSDRYLYLKNQGIERLLIDLNGHAFTLVGQPAAHEPENNIFGIPSLGEVTIDIFDYLQPGGNTMTIAFAGPPGSRAELILSDMTIKNEVDFVLQLTPLPQQFVLSQNQPNPFHAATMIPFTIPARANEAQVELKIYNVLGQLVRTLVEAKMPTGHHRVAWDGRDETGRAVTSGVYFYHLVAGETRKTMKMAVMR